MTLHEVGNLSKPVSFRSIFCRKLSWKKRGTAGGLFGTDFGKLAALKDYFKKKNP